MEKKAVRQGKHDTSSGTLFLHRIFLNLGKAWR